MIKSSPRDTVISSRPHQSGSQIIVGVDSIAMANQEGTGLILDRDTFEVQSDIIKLSPNSGGDGIILDQTPINPKLYLSEEYSAEFCKQILTLALLPPMYRSGTLYAITRAKRKVSGLAAILAILRTPGPEFKLDDRPNPTDNKKVHRGLEGKYTVDLIKSIKNNMMNISPELKLVLRELSEGTYKSDMNEAIPLKTLTGAEGLESLMQEGDESLNTWWF